MKDTPGDRVKKIRKALGEAEGDDTYPISQAELAERLKAKSGKRYRDDTITKMERGVRKVSESDARWLAELDPLNRGPGWILGWPPSVLGQSWSPERDLPSIEKLAAKDDAAQGAEPHPHTTPKRRAK